MNGSPQSVFVSRHILGDKLRATRAYPPIYVQGQSCCMRVPRFQSVFAQAWQDLKSLIQKQKTGFCTDHDRPYYYG